MVNSDRRTLIRAAAGIGLFGAAHRPGAFASTGAATGCRAVLSHRLRPLAGEQDVSLCERFSGQVLLIVNTASKCGFTPQFEALETLYGRYAARGLAVLGFPSDDFRQELADEADVAEFCRLNYGVTFPMFQKVRVVGAEAHPLFRDLAAAEGQPRWNFNKYLLDRDGHVRARYDSSVPPLGNRLVTDIEALL